MMTGITGKKAHGKSINLRVSLWHNEREIKLDFPSEWDLIECRMAGHNLSRLSNSQMLDAFENPIGTPRIRDLAKGKQRVVIIFDDLARPTPVYEIIPYILRELEEGGIRGDKIRLICATGCHRPLIREELIQKLGREVVENYSVFNHNLYEYHTNLGTTSRGTPVLINREVASCDLKIGIGCLVPHFNAGYGGGAKILLPGVSSIDTITYNHIDVMKLHPEQIGLGKVKYNPMRLDMEEAARIAGLDVVVDVVVNHKKEILGIFAGDIVESHREGVKFANKVYRTENYGKFDLIVANAFPIEETPKKALWPAKESLNEGGDAVLIWQTAVGWHPHYLRSPFGSDYGGRKWEKPGPFRLPHARKLYIYTESLTREERKHLGPSDKVVWYHDWNKLIDALKPFHSKETRVAIYPYATIQCPAFKDED